MTATLPAPRPSLPVFRRSLPPSVGRALAASVDHPDVPWAPPAVLPPQRDLRDAVTVLEGRLRQVSPDLAEKCVASLLLTFEPNTKMTPGQLKLRAESWIVDCGDIPDDLWAKATAECRQTLKWMPKPVEFRACVGAEMTRRSDELRRAQQMLLAAQPAPEVNTLDRAGRLAQSIAFWRGRGLDTRAAPHERELAREQGRLPEEWAVAVRNPALPFERPPPLPISPTMEAATLRAVARHHAGTAYADRLKVRADALDPGPLA